MIFDDSFQTRYDTVQRLFCCLQIRKHRTKQYVNVFLKVFGQYLRLINGGLQHALFTGMGHTVQREDHIETSFQKRRRAVVDRDKISALRGFLDLRVIGRQIAVQQPHTALDDILAQLFRIRYAEPFNQLAESTFAVIQYPACQDVVPYAGGVGVRRMTALHHIGEPVRNFADTAVKDIDIHTVLERAVVLQLPEGVSLFDIGAVCLKDLSADAVIRNRVRGALEPISFLGRSSLPNAVARRLRSASASSKVSLSMIAG